MTSLQRQLKRLKTPQTEEFRQERYRASFLYQRKEASAIDCDTHLRIAYKALKRLIKHNDELEEFTDLFSDESKNVERSALKKDENEQLSGRIRKFINCCFVPFFMLNDCHETFEYLIYKYHVHTYETNDLISALLPYHETRLFARALQLIPNLDSSLWGWLEPYKKEGVPVPKERILSVLASRSKLGLVALLGDKLIEINRDSDKASPYTSFYTVTIMCILDQDLDEKFFVTLMPHIYKIIRRPRNTNLFMAGLVLFGYLAYTQELEDAYVGRIMEKLAETYPKLREKEEKNRDLLDEYYQKVQAVIKRQQEKQ